ncbi:MAG: cobalamin-dependent protein [Planctomycetota bacterium]
MDAQGQFVAALLDSSAKALASSAVARLGEPEASGIEGWSFGDAVADVKSRIESLAEALAAGSPSMLRLDFEWLAATYAARGVPLDLLVRSLRALREELRDSLPAEAAAMAGAYLDEAAQGLNGELPELATLLVDGDPHVELARAFLVAVLEGRRDDAERLLLDAADGGVSIPDLHRWVLTRAQAEMGRLWQKGDVHVVEEHLGSRIVEEALILLRSRMPRAEPNGRTALVASVSGNLHDIGARTVADHFEMAGWRSLFVGANAPSEDLVAAVKHFKVDLVALSAGAGLNLRATAQQVEALRAAYPDLPVLVGGRPFSQLPELAQAVGADGSAQDARGAVLEAERLLAISTS